MDACKLYWTLRKDTCKKPNSGMSFLIINFNFSFVFVEASVAAVFKTFISFSTYPPPPRFCRLVFSWFSMLTFGRSIWLNFLTSILLGS